MLYTNVLDGKTLDLLKKLMQLPEFAAFYLVGGTALALQMGHRKSFDLDLFGDVAFDSDEIILKLGELGVVEERQKSPKILQLTVSGIKVDIVHYKYPALFKPVVEPPIRMLSKQDIAAMKISAISTRGAKRDFFDMYFLIMEFGLSQIMDFYRKKFKASNTFHALKSLTYFVDAEGDPDPMMLKSLSWEKAKDYITLETHMFLKTIG